MKKKIFRGVALILALCTMLGIASGCGCSSSKKSDGVIEITMWTDVGEDATEAEKELEAWKDEALAKKFPNIKINKIVKESAINNEITLDDEEEE